MSIRTSNDDCITHRWELTFNTGDYRLRCSKDGCEISKLTTCRGRLCLLCRNGIYQEIAYCYGNITKLCIHGASNKHLVFQCDNRYCQTNRNEKL
jgi:hypothetical protein